MTLGRALRSAALAVVVAMAGQGTLASEARDALLDQERALAYSRQAIGRSVSDHRLLDRVEQPVRLGEQRGRPLVLLLIYTSCAHTCPMTVQNLRRVVEIARDALGAGAFAVWTIGFDARVDTPARMRAYAAAQGIDVPGWEFLSADAATIGRLAEEVGFLFRPSAGGFDHLAQVTLLDGDGRVHAQIYGSNFAPQALIEPLKDLVFGRAARPISLASLADRVRLLCTVYDPSTGRYRFSYAIFIGLIIGGASLAAVATFLISAWLRARRA